MSLACNAERAVFSGQLGPLDFGLSGATRGSDSTCQTTLLKYENVFFVIGTIFGIIFDNMAGLFSIDNNEENMIGEILGRTSHIFTHQPRKRCSKAAKRKKFSSWFCREDSSRDSLVIKYLSISSMRRKSICFGRSRDAVPE